MEERQRRRSYPREVVLRVLKACYDHPTAYAVYERARKIKPDISRGTVYRNLKQMEARGEVLALPTGGAFTHYDGHTEEHAHFVCRGCGAIEDIPMKGWIPEELKNGHIVTESRNIYYGYCKKCATEAVAVLEKEKILRKEKEL